MKRLTLALLLLCSCAHSPKPAPKLKATVRFNKENVSIFVYGNSSATREMVRGMAYRLADLTCKYEELSYMVFDVNPGNEKAGQLLIRCIKKQETI